MKAAIAPTRVQLWLLNWLIPILIVGMIVPIVLSSVCLALSQGSVAEAVDHGELFLGSANAIVVSSTVLLAGRLDRILEAVIASMSAMLLLGIPLYLAWAYTSTQALLKHPYDQDLVVKGGVLSVLVSLLLSGFLVAVATKSATPEGQSK